MDSQYTDILITGAGPTGLMLAAQLTRWGADCVVIDKKSCPTKESRALVVQARSLEIYEQMGLSDEVVGDGHVTEGIRLFEGGRIKATVSLGDLRTVYSPFPFVLVYEQNKNEALLYRYLQSHGKEVQWNTELKGITQEDGRYVVDTGSTRYSCTYLLACDGARSPIRDWTGMSFTGGTYEHVFYVADTHADGDMLDKDRLSIFIGKNDFTLVFPMPGHHCYRVLGTLPPEFYHKEEVGFDAVEGQAKANMQIPVTFYDTNWYSTYKLHHKKVSHFRKDNVFFVGDAAHVHSPAGGQGMNTGLQDAYNLAWKLALVVRGNAAPALLDTYHDERNPVAEQLLRFTDRLFSVATHSGMLPNFIKMTVMPRLLPLVNRFARLRGVLFRAVSQIQIHYRSSRLSQGKAGRVAAGDRFPYFRTARGLSVYQLIRERQVKPFLIVVYGLAAETVEPGGLATVLFLDGGAAIKDTGLPSSFVAVLRPDIYIGYIAGAIHPAEIRAYFGLVTGIPTP